MAARGTRELAEQVGRLIRLEREARDLSVAEVAHRMRVQATHVRRWELGYQLQSLDTLYRLARALQCHVEDLIPRRPILPTFERPPRPQRRTPQVDIPFPAA